MSQRKQTNQTITRQRCRLIATTALVSALLASSAHAESDSIQLRPPAGYNDTTTIQGGYGSVARNPAAVYTAGHASRQRTKPLAPVKILLPQEPAQYYAPPPSNYAPPPTQPLTQTATTFYAAPVPAPAPAPVAYPESEPAPAPAQAAAPAYVAPTVPPSVTYTAPSPSDMSPDIAQFYPSQAAPTSASEPTQVVAPVSPPATEVSETEELPPALPPSHEEESVVAVTPPVAPSIPPLPAEPSAFSEELPPNTPNLAAILPSRIPAPSGPVGNSGATVISSKPIIMNSNGTMISGNDVSTLAPSSAPNSEIIAPIVDETSKDNKTFVKIPAGSAPPLSSKGPTEVITSPSVQIVRHVGSVGDGSEPTAVPTVPPVKEVTDLASGAVPPAFTTDAGVAPSVPDPVIPVATLSPETRAILQRLPTHLKDKSDSTAMSKDPIKMDRVNPAVEVFGDEPYTSSEAVGVKIEVKSPPPDTDHELEMAYEALLSGQTEAAIELYQRALQASPNDTTALFGLATTYHRLGRLDKARPYYGKLLSIDPNNREGLTNFLSLVAEESPKEALVELERLELKNPDFSPIPAQVALVYQKLGDLDKAAEKMTTAMQLSPDNLVYRYNLAIIMDKLGRKDEAKALYSQLLAAFERGAVIPGSVDKIQERLTFIQSN